MKCCTCGMLFDPDKYHPHHKYCKDCTLKKRKEYNRKYQETHTEKRLESANKWRERYPERSRESSRRWRAANPNKVKEINRKYKENNPEKVKEIQMKYQKSHPQKRRSNQLKRYYSNKQRALAYKGGRCVVSGRTDSISYHHLDPNEKDCDVAYLLGSKWNTLKVELDKCIPMCGDLHSSMENELRVFIKKLGGGGYPLSSEEK